MDLDAAADELYGGSPDDFIERRKALVAQARAAKDRELARRISELRRPTRTAWLVNVLARESPEEVAALLQLGTALEDAQRRKDGPELRRLSAERRRSVDRLARESVALGARHGYAAPDASLQEVSQTLQAGLGDPGVRDQLRTGRLATAVSYAGFGPTDLMAALAASLPGAESGAEAEEPEAPPVTEAEPATEALSDVEPEPEPEPVPSAAAEPAPAATAEPESASAAESESEPAARAEHDPAAPELSEAAVALQRAREALAETELDAEEATARADELADRIEELRGELADVEAEEVLARSAARSARRRLQEQRRAVAAAERAAGRAPALGPEK